MEHARSDPAARTDSQPAEELAGSGGFPDIDYSMLDYDALIGVVSPNVLRSQGVPVNPDTLRAADAVLRWQLDDPHFGFGSDVADPEIRAADELVTRIGQRNEDTEGQG